jgi:ATP-dependent exoDNAse (exonuclease V) alpha subunit
MRQETLQRKHLDALKERLSREPPADEPIVRLCTHNHDADTENAAQLARLTGTSRKYLAATTGKAADLSQLADGVLAPFTLELKQDAEVMFVVNNPAGGYVNGMRGRVAGFRRSLPRVRLATGRTITVKPYSWALTDGGRERATMVQLPLRLGWAITIHKSQGMSLDAAAMNLRQCFAPGMGYVALSRVRSLDRVYLTGINRMALQLDPEIRKLDQRLRIASGQLEQAIFCKPRRPIQIGSASTGLWHRFR